MASSVPFHFQSVRQLQKSSLDRPEKEPYCSFDEPSLCAVNEALDAADVKKALTLVDDVVARNERACLSYLAEAAAASAALATSPLPAPETRTLHQALLCRSEIRSKTTRDYLLARNDLEKAILMKPLYVDAYRLLSDVERRRDQYGRAEVALLLGLGVDPANAGLKVSLADLRKVDRVVGEVRSKDGSDAALRERQREAGYALVPSNMPPLVLCVMMGDLEALKGIWTPEARDFKHGFNNPIMHFPVLGAQRFPDWAGKKKLNEREKARMLDNYKATIDFLFDRGARLDARDYAGYTAVMHAAGHLPQPELLRHLLSKGADPNVRSAYGTVALTDASMQQNLKEIDILMTYGADPNVADNDGVTPLSVGEKFRQVVAVYHRHMFPEMPARLCQRCSSAKGTKRCTKCRVVYYCGKDCQLGDWPAHKKLCKKLCASHKRVAIGPVKNEESLVAVDEARSKIMKNVANAHVPNYEPEETDLTPSQLFEVYNEEWNKTGNMLLKFQAVTKPGEAADWQPDAEKDLLVYNERKNFRCSVDVKKLDGPELLAIIRDKGVGHVKAYFWAFMEKGKPEILTVITDPIHRAQKW